MQKIKEKQDLEQMFRRLGSIWAKRSMMINEHKAEDANGLQFGWMPWEGSSDSSASTLSQMDEYIIRDRSDDVPNFPDKSALCSQSADVKVACGQHAMMQPLQRNWCWFHEQRKQRAYSAFLELLLTCFYLHSLKVSQLEKESQEQRERCKMLSAELENANNLYRTSLKSLKDVLEETVLRGKSFGIPECDVEVHATDSGQFLPPTDLPMSPRDSNNLKAKDVRADGPSDASTTMPNRWCRKRGERRKLEQVKNKLSETQEQCANPYAAASNRRSADDVEKASSSASDMDTHSGAPDVASQPEAKKSSRFLQLIRL